MGFSTCMNFLYFINLIISTLLFLSPADNSGLQLWPRRKRSWTEDLFDGNNRAALQQWSWHRRALPSRPLGCDWGQKLKLESANQNHITHVWYILARACKAFSVEMKGFFVCLKPLLSI